MRLRHANIFVKSRAFNFWEVIKMKKTALGVIGAGNVGRVHIGNIMTAIPQAKLKCVADPYPAKYNEWAREMEYPEAVTDYKKIMEAARAGKHVFCEKPFDYDIAKIVKAMKVVEECKVKLQLGFNRRFLRNGLQTH